MSLSFVLFLLTMLITFVVMKPLLTRNTKRSPIVVVLGCAALLLLAVLAISLLTDGLLG